MKGLAGTFGAARVTTSTYWYLAIDLKSHQVRDDVKHWPLLANFNFFIDVGSGGNVIRDSLSIPSHRQ